jgi:hypothetical protein
MSDFIDDEASESVVSSASSVPVRCRGGGRVRARGVGRAACGRGRGHPRRVVVGGHQGSDLDKQSCYWLLTFYYAVLNGELWEDDVANGHSKQDLSEIVSGISEDVLKKLDYLVIGFEFCKSDHPSTPGRPHAHVYLEFKCRKRGHQVC